MIIQREAVRAHLQQLLEERGENVEWLTDICWLLYLVHEFSRHSKRKNSNRAQKFFIQRLRSQNSCATYTYDPAFPDQPRPREEDFSQARALYIDLVNRSGNQGKLIRVLVNERWEAGLRRHRMYGGSLTNALSDEAAIVANPAIVILSDDTYVALRNPMSALVAQ